MADNHEYKTTRLLFVLKGGSVELWKEQKKKKQKKTKTKNDNKTNDNKTKKLISHDYTPLQRDVFLFVCLFVCFFWRGLVGGGGGGGKLNTVARKKTSTDMTEHF